MSHLEILEKNYNEQMLGVKIGITTFNEFKVNYKTLLEVILQSMADVERTTNANNLVVNRTSVEPKFK